MGDLGAAVIKVERVGSGDDGRDYGLSWHNDAAGNKTRESSFYLSCNRNKKSITIDHAKPAGQTLIRKLAGKCDVLVENYKVGDLKRFALDYESLGALYPRLIYCSVTGFGQTGPNARRAGYDGLFQAQGGMMAVTGVPERQPGAGPLKAGPSLVDVFTGHNAALGNLAALIHRDRSGRGQYIDIALLDCSVAMVSHITQDFLVSGIAPKRIGNGGGPADLFKCRDGIIYMSAGTQDHWARLCKLMARPELYADTRFDSNLNRFHNRTELLSIIEQWTEKWATAELLNECDLAAIPAARYNELADVFCDPQVQHRGLKVTVPHPVSGSVDLIGSPLGHMSATPANQFRAPPDDWTTYR